jgi:hypothetical protein
MKSQETMDAELLALAALVITGSRQMQMADEERFMHGNAPAYGDTPAVGQYELEAELKLRGILK